MKKSPLVGFGGVRLGKSRPVRLGIFSNRRGCPVWRSGNVLGRFDHQVLGHIDNFHRRSRLGRIGLPGRRRGDARFGLNRGQLHFRRIGGWRARHVRGGFHRVCVLIDGQRRWGRDRTRGWIKLLFQCPRGFIHRFPVGRPRLQSEIFPVFPQGKRAIVQALLRNDREIQQGRAKIRLQLQGGVEILGRFPRAVALGLNHPQPVQGFRALRVEAKRLVETFFRRSQFAQPQLGVPQFHPTVQRIALVQNKRGQLRPG